MERVAREMIQSPALRRHAVVRNADGVVPVPREHRVLGYLVDGIEHPVHPADVQAMKIGHVVEVPCELLLDAGAVEPTEQERAEYERQAADSERRRAERAAVLAAAREQLAAIDDPLARAVLDLHCENERGECLGDDFDGVEGESPAWPCTTTVTVARHFGIDLGDRQ
jgi:hypothetical protein